MSAGLSWTTGVLQRSQKSHDEAEEDFENILKFSEEFDRASRLVENMSKRQKWTGAGKERVENLGSALHLPTLRSLWVLQ